MKRERQMAAVALAGAMALAAAHAQTPPKMKMTTPIPPSITTPDSVDTRIGNLKFFDGFPDDATVQKVYDNLDFERGVQDKVTFGGVKATTFGVNTDNQVTANVPTGAKTGHIAITTPGGNAVSSGIFTVTSEAVSFGIRGYRPPDAWAAFFCVTDWWQP